MGDPAIVVEYCIFAVIVGTCIDIDVSASGVADAVPTSVVVESGIFSVGPVLSMDIYVSVGGDSLGHGLAAVLSFVCHG